MKNEARGVGSPLKRRGALLAIAASLALASLPALANQQYEPMSASVRAALHAAVSDSAAPRLLIADDVERTRWLDEMSRRLAKRIPDERYRHELLITVHYESTRAGLDPQLVLGLIQVESAFRKYAISSAGARGYMQVMPFWVGVIGRKDDNLFHLRTNLRYGCTILRHYLDIEKGDLFRALGRYNGSLGKPTYPNLVRTAWERDWHYAPLNVATSRAAPGTN
ncbi:MAG: lytic transglycosylase domain-containing protein [Rhodocyclaceae bacterium]|jgi:soluble lytic murein transglycosylase-like protein|nr:lytic transglycosylase domain-containing protein [Rhodocyclaceae bacterium]MCL4759680.1 lytic transglycosylase domain-containing protein [Rhodocyclaceae bacterium]